MPDKKIKKLINDNWPKTKKEFERVLKTTMQLLSQGETYLKEVSEKGLKETKKISLKLKKEKMYYELGKLVAKTPQSKLGNNQNIKDYVSEIKKLSKTDKK
ncbi:MAG: hypothetical protein PHP69_00760 [Candidatus Omnitrophica bacterium]|jgi:hypothetical protein|nr:hypothetical protein [Candidatus Omnitrophota bacterium]MDD5080939.1 hypothetical protein [Candidatus Omnitrophota bacterium]MDD5440582.1 hypothetical protein [Candidatus Omnitrophota bacterium]